MGPADRRWEKGLSHHPLSERIVEAVRSVDTDLEADLKIGGDGDFGETIMYLLDEWIEQHGCCPACRERQEK